MHPGNKNKKKVEYLTEIQGFLDTVVKKGYPEAKVAANLLDKLIDRQSDPQDPFDAGTLFNGDPVHDRSIVLMDEMLDEGDEGVSAKMVIDILFDALEFIGAALGTVISVEAARKSSS